jgi:hypothetical protein
MYTIQYNKNKGFFYVKLTGKVNHLEIIGYLKKICDLSEQNKILKVMADYRNAEIDETSTEPIKKIAGFFNTEIKSKCGQIIWSNVSVDYLPTTGSIILQNLIMAENVEYQPFTSIDGALAWMRLKEKDMNELEILTQKN